MSAGQYCNRQVVVISQHETPLDAARLMREYHVGDLVVVQETNGRRLPIGILTDRDIVVELIANDVALDSVSVADAMSFDLTTAEEDDDIHTVIAMMRSKGIRRMPIVDREGVLVGILTVDDVIDLLAEQLTDVSRLVTRQQHREQVSRD